MKIKLIKPDLEGDFMFQISDKSGTLLTSSDYNDRKTCLAQLEEVLVELRQNDQIAIQTGNNNQYYFEVLGLAQSPSFGDLEKASDVLAKLKEFATQQSDFEVIYEKTEKRAISKKQLGLREELYDFSKVSNTRKAGFELIDGNQPNRHFFHFNDSEGFALLYSRFFDGKRRRIKAIRNIIKNAKKEERYEVVNQGNQYFFIIKTKEGYEIARSRTFQNETQMKLAIAYLKETAADYNKAFKLPKKKKKKKTAKEKYHLKQNAPLGLIGFEGFKSRKNKMHYFHFHDKQGQALLFSRYFEKRKDRDAAISEVIKRGAKRKYYKTWAKNKKQHYFSIVDKKGKSYARSRYFSSKKEMIAGMNHLQKNAGGYGKELNTVSVAKEKIYKIKLAEKAKIAKPIPTIIPAVKPPKIKEQAPVIETILPQPGIKIETEPVVENITHPTPTPPPVPARQDNPPTPIKEEILAKTTTRRSLWPWILGGIASILLLALLIKNCGQTPASKVLPKPEIVEQPAPPKVKKPTPVEPARVGPSAAELKLAPNTAEARMADFLSLPTTKTPKIFILESVQFPFSSAVLTPTSFAQLDNVLRVLQTYPKTKIEVNGHTDSRGDEGMNLTLSESRAKAVKDYLINKGIAENRILKAVGFGETTPIATNATDEGRQENRRSEIVVVER